MKLITQTKAHWWSWTWMQHLAFLSCGLYLLFQTQEMIWFHSFLVKNMTGLLRHTDPSFTCQALFFSPSLFSIIHLIITPEKVLTVKCFQTLLMRTIKKRPRNWMCCLPPPFDYAYHIVRRFLFFMWTISPFSSPQGFFCLPKKFKSLSDRWPPYFKDCFYSNETFISKMTLHSHFTKVPWWFLSFQPRNIFHWLISLWGITPSFFF